MRLEISTVADLEPSAEKATTMEHRRGVVWRFAAALFLALVAVALACGALVPSAGAQEGTDAERRAEERLEGSVGEGAPTLGELRHEVGLAKAELEERRQAEAVFLSGHAGALRRGEAAVEHEANYVHALVGEATAEHEAAVWRVRALGSHERMLDAERNAEKVKTASG